MTYTLRVASPCDECLREGSMLDVMMLAIGLAFFVVAVGYVIACDRM